MRLFIFVWCLLITYAAAAQKQPASDDVFSPKTLIPYKPDSQDPKWGGSMFYGPYEIKFNGCGQAFIREEKAGKNNVLFYTKNNTCAGIIDPAMCYAVHGPKLLFVMISDGYLTPRTQRVVEISLDKLKYRWLVRGKQVSCPTYTPDGKFLLVTVDGVARRVRSRFK